MSSSLFFAQVREDARVERMLLDRFAARRVLVIASGGCTALSLLDDRLESLLAVDSNPAQIALLELRIAALRRLDRLETLRFIGELEATDRAETFAKLSCDLSQVSRGFWDNQMVAVERGINQCGVTERFYRFVGDNLRRNVVDEGHWRRLFDCRSIDAQLEFLQVHCSTERWKTALRVLLSRTTHVAFYPAFMFANAEEDDFGEFFGAQFERELERRPVWDNYFLSQLIFGSYLLDVPEGTPTYLSEEGYARARRNLDKLSFAAIPVERALSENSPFDAVFLSNVFDWSTLEARSALTGELSRCTETGAILLFRNMLGCPELPESFTRYFVPDEALSSALHAEERSMLYRSLTVARRR